jgi:hypothetical protein
VRSQAQLDAVAPGSVSTRARVRAQEAGVIDLRFGKWETALVDVECDALICDPPYSPRVHASKASRNDGTSPDGLTPSYAPWTAKDVLKFVKSWHPRVRGWIVCLCDDMLIDAYRAAFRAVDRQDFQPIPCCIAGMSCRMLGDGPSSEAIYAMVARPRSKDFMGGWSMRGYYVGNSVRPGMATDAPTGGGRGKPSWLEHALVRDYSRRGDRVCDPVAGWGGTLTAAVALGRTAVGAEMDERTYTEAMRRLRRPLQVDLFAASGV